MTAHHRVLYWRVIHRDFSLDEAVISRVVRPVMSHHCPAGNWHYLRYFDERGPHIRVRVFTESASDEMLLLDRVTSDLERGLISVLDSVQASDHRQAGLFGATHLPLPSTRDAGVHISLYEPEEQKYAGPEGLRIAEEIWNASTQEAVRHLDPAWTPESRLLHTAGDAYLATVRFFGSDFQAIRSFWTGYAKFWSGGDQNRLAELPESVFLQDMIPALDDVVRTRSKSDSSWPERLAQMCQGDPMQLNHQVHLHNNRLGVGPEDEAALAVLILLVHRARAAGPASGESESEQRRGRVQN